MRTPEATIDRPAASPAAASTVARSATAMATVSHARLRYWTLVASHLFVDLYPPFVLSLAVALQARLRLADADIALIFAVSPVISGLSQPLCAWFADRFNTRIFAPLGLALGAVALSSIGFADSLWQLIALQIVGMTGTGIYHPVASALAGRLAGPALEKRGAHNGGARKSARSFGISIFFTAGMLGGSLGPIIATRINDPESLGFGGMEWLTIMIAPGVIMAGLLRLASHRVPHRTERLSVRETTGDAGELTDAEIDVVACVDDPAHARARWLTVGLLFIANSMRFTVNIGLYYLYGVWARQTLDNPALASNMHGNLIAASALGMGVSALVIGRIDRAGHERTPMALSGVLTALPVALMALYPTWAMYAAAFIAAWGFFGPIPTSLALAQRLLPHATGMTGSILMGCGWAVSASAPYLGELMINLWGLPWAFAGFGAMLAGAGLLSLAASGRLLRETAHLA